MKYMGPFLRINTLKKENIKNQLFYYSKESLKHIVLYSKCGITLPFKELKSKNSLNFDINTFKSISPLLCIYKKGSAKLINEDGKLHWNEEKFKKQVNIYSNALMTLNLLELCDYYTSFEAIDSNKFNLSYLYLNIAKNQLEFYASYFRNSDGFFVDKIDISDSIIGDFKFEDKNKKFSYSDQAFMMAALYKYSLYEGGDTSSYKDFALDILNTLIQFKEALYSLSIEELCNLCLALNIFYKYSMNYNAKILLLDLCELLVDKYTNNLYSSSNKRLEYDCLIYLNCALFQKNTGLKKFNETIKKINKSLANLYVPELGIFKNYSLSKEIELTCTEIVLYFMCILMDSDKYESENINFDIIKDVFKNAIVNSGLVLSWPETPDMNDVERYKNYSLKSDDLLDEEYFRMPSIASMENNELAPVFSKAIIYNTKKDSFIREKDSFDSNKNMLIIYILISYLKP